MRRSILKLILLAVALIAAAPGTTLAAPDLMVYPSRVVMNDRQRTGQVEIINTSQTQATYMITLVRKRMTEMGEFLDASTPLPEEKFADEVIKYSPRQVTLVPGASQTIRMMFKIPQDLADGEYRSHLLFSKPPAAISELPSKDDTPPSGVSMRISTSMAISIPVIARHGRLTSEAAIVPESVKLTSSGANQQVELALARKGTRSIYGDVAVFRGDDKVGEAKGLAVYFPNQLRKIGVPVAGASPLKAGEAIKIVFTEKDETRPMAETVVNLP